MSAKHHSVCGQVKLAQSVWQKLFRIMQGQSQRICLNNVKRDSICLNLSQITLYAR